MDLLAKSQRVKMAHRQMWTILRAVRTQKLSKVSLAKSQGARMVNHQAWTIFRVVRTWQVSKELSGGRGPSVSAPAIVLPDRRTAHWLPWF